MYVLDINKTPVPIGVIGELYIAGAGLARGYLNKSELTQQRFLPNPFATDEDIANGYNRLYKTGDLVRWLPDGNLSFIGRNDTQVKIRGYRIELGEIEQAMLQIPGIKESTVLLKQRETTADNIKYLVGYYTLEENYNADNDISVLETWENLYDDEYSKNVEQLNITADFTGWNSYITGCLLYTSPSPRDATLSRMPSSA